MKNRIFALLLALVLVVGLCACGAAQEAVEVRVGALNGPTGIGMSKLMEDAEKGETKNDYSFTLAAAPTDLNASVINGDLDICALPTNVAATLYNKTGGEVQILALNTLGVLYILENGNSVADVKDLAGRTIYATGQASNPEYVLNHILRENGLEPGVDVQVEFLASEELSTRMAAGELELCMLPVPAVTGVLMKNKDVRIALDLTEAWNALDSDSTLTMGCIVVRRAFAQENPKAVAQFLKEYAESVGYVVDEPAQAAELVAKFGITPSAQVAQAAIPDCNLVCITGTDVQDAIEGYYQVLFAADPTSIGGAVPEDDFYYTEK